MGKGGYGLTYQEVYEMENLTIEAKAIYGMLCSYAGSKAMAYPSVDFICVGIKLCARTIESMKKLIIDLAQLYGVQETLCVRIPESEEEGLLQVERSIAHHIRKCSMT